MQRGNRSAVPHPGLEASVEPIRNPVTGKAHRAVIRLPKGFEFREAEMGSSAIRSTGVSASVATMLYDSTANLALVRHFTVLLLSRRRSGNRSVPLRRAALSRELGQQTPDEASLV